MKRCGFTLTEVLVVLAILPIFMLISTELYRAILITANVSQRQLAAQATFDAATAQMWRDLFAARSVQSNPDGAILITERTGSQIRWQSSQANLLRIAADRRLFTVPYELHLRAALQNQSIELQLIGPNGWRDQASCFIPNWSRS